MRLRYAGQEAGEGRGNVGDAQKFKACPFNHSSNTHAAHILYSKPFFQQDICVGEQASVPHK